MFKETADIKTADQLHLPAPEVEYHVEKAQPSEQQKGLVQQLSGRAAKQRDKSARAAGDRAASGTELHALGNLLQDMEPDIPFSIYEDTRDKLIAKGIPPAQIAFIHDANTEVRKKVLFSKVRSGQVRVLMGSTFKMGAG